MRSIIRRQHQVQRSAADTDIKAAFFWQYCRASAAALSLWILIVMQSDCEEIQIPISYKIFVPAGNVFTIWKGRWPQATSSA